MNLPMFFAPPPQVYASRRQFLQRAGSGFGMMALAGLLQREQLLAVRCVLDKAIERIEHAEQEGPVMPRRTEIRIE